MAQIAPPPLFVEALFHLLCPALFTMSSPKLMQSVLRANLKHSPKSEFDEPYVFPRKHLPKVMKGMHVLQAFYSVSVID